MANPIIKIKRGATAPVATLNAGEFAIDQVAKNLYLGVEVGGAVTNEIVGGEGTFATKAYVTTALGGVSGTLGNMAVQNKETINITGGTIDGVDITNGSVQNTVIDGTTIGATTPSTGTFTTLTATTLDGNIDANTAVITHGMFQTAVINGNTEITDSYIENTTIGANTPSTGAFTTLTASNAPSASTDVVRKTDLDSAISALGSVFHYVGNVSLATTPFDLGTLPDLNTGSYYRVDVAGTYVDATYPDVEAKVGDAFVFTATNGFQKLDNVDVQVFQTPNEITVTGDENAGYTVSIDPVFSGRVSNTESLTQNFGSVAAGSTEINGNIWGNGSLTLDGFIDIGGNADILGNLTAANISTTGTVGGTNITDLETKTQNIDLSTTAGETIVTGVIKSASNRTGIDFVNSSIYAYDGTSEFKVLVVYDDLEVGKDVYIGTDPTGGSLTVTGNSTLTGNLSVTGNITDAVIDGGVY